MGLAFLITTENLQLLSERKVLKEAEYAALLDASAVVDAGRKEAQRIVRQAARQAEDDRRKGFEQGLQQAKADYAQKLAMDAQAAERQLRALRGSMANIVVKAVGQFLQDADPAALFERALSRVDTLIRNERFLSVRVSPSQEAMVREVMARMQAEGNWSVNVSIAADPALSSDECVLQTDSGTLEIGLAAQLDAFRKAVERSGLGNAQ